MPKDITLTIPIIYSICVIASVMLLICYTALVKEKKIWMQLMLVSVCVVNVGYLYLSLAGNLTHALLANRIAYLGNAFQPLLMLLAVADLCNIKMKKPVAITLLSIATLMFLGACSAGILPIFYRTVEYAVVDGVVKLSRTYGFLHSIYTVYVCSYMIAVAWMTAYAIFKKKLVIYRYVVMMALIATTNVAVWVVERFARGNYEFLSISYIFTCLLMVLLYSELSENGLPAVVVDFSDSKMLTRASRYYSVNRILSHRESEILALLLQGLGRKEIAEQLFITENTVKTHTTKVYNKLGVSNKDELQHKVADDIRMFLANY